MAHDYRQLYQHMAKSSSSLLPELSAEANPFRNRLAESEASNDQGTGADASRLFWKAHPACCVLWREARLIYFWGAAIAPSSSLPPRLSFNLVSHC